MCMSVCMYVDICIGLDCESMWMEVCVCLCLSMCLCVGVFIVVGGWEHVVEIFVQLCVSVHMCLKGYL